MLEEKHVIDVRVEKYAVTKGGFKVIVSVIFKNGVKLHDDNKKYIVLHNTDKDTYTDILKEKVFDIKIEGDKLISFKVKKINVLNYFLTLFNMDGYECAFEREVIA